MDKGDKPKQNIVDKAGFVSSLFIWWIVGLIRYGFRHDLTQKDMYDASAKDRSEPLGDALEKAWNEQVEVTKKTSRKPRLFPVISKVFLPSYLLWGFVVAFQTFVLSSGLPFILARLISYYNHGSQMSYKEAHLYAGLLTLFSFMNSISFSHLHLGQQRIGMRVRIACCSLMYRKILRLSKYSMGQTAAGQVVNLMSNDVNRFDLAATYLHFLWIAPFHISMIAYLMWADVGISSLAGILVIITQSVLVQGVLSGYQAKLRAQIAVKTDNRVKLMSELVNGIQVIKMYAWELPFEKMVAKARRLEMNLVTKTLLINGFSGAIMIFTERLTLYATVVAFIYLGGVPKASTVYSLAQYYNILQMICSYFLPLALVNFGEVRISVKRIEAFLQLEENNEIECIQKETTFTSKNLILKDVSAYWGTQQITTTLTKINMEVKYGEFCAIVGAVGSGKSSLLQLLLKELLPSSGSVNMDGLTISYASQEPWLFVGTVRDNILFGQPFDKDRYAKVVKACALVKDFEQFRRGDNTIVGERGVSLSGGQRARINLARAVYRKADLYLLDDPLSAVDTHVGKHLLEECIKGFLGNKSRILVTHQLHHLKTADKIIILKNGMIEAEGTFANVSTNALFSEVLEKNSPENAEEIDEKEVTTLSIVSAEEIAEDSLQIESNKVDEEPDENEELIAKGVLKGSVVKKYWTAGVGIFFLTMTMIIMILAQVVTTMSDLWLRYWINGEFSESKTQYAYTTKMSILIWSILLLLCIILTSIRMLMLMWVCAKSSIGLHDVMFKNVLQATMRFFDTNPSGRILNRFSKDMGATDELLPKPMVSTFQVFLVFSGVVVMVALVNPLTILFIILIFVLVACLSQVYLRTALSVKRIEGVTRSPVFSHVTSTLFGISTIRSSNAQEMLKEQFDQHQNVHTGAWYVSIAATGAFSMWISGTCCIFVTAVIYTFLLLDDGTTRSADVGLAISQSLTLVLMVQGGVKLYTDAVSQMTSVERILEYTDLTKEHPLESPPGKEPAKTWPSQGALVLRNVYLKYVEGGEPVLKNLNVVIESGWKVGIVGRTGAGKTSLISALFRLAIVEGDIYIDDVDTSQIGLKDLRHKISIIPQEPVLFSASLRYNLDPFGKHSDDAIWNALEDVELKSSIVSLSHPVQEGGSNFSAGQRQLLCLARAALNHNKILVLDEATANVDPTTDGLIQKTIRSRFASCTVLTVAHRLHTVADSDRVLVMDFGEAVQYEHPHVLLQDRSGIFSQMVEQLGPESEAGLRDIAQKAYMKQCKD